MNPDPFLSVFAAALLLVALLLGVWPCHSPGQSIDRDEQSAIFDDQSSNQSVDGDKILGNDNPADEERKVDESGDDTADYDVETTVDQTEPVVGPSFDGDLRPIIDHFERDLRDGSSASDSRAGFRFRLGGDYGITETLHTGARVAWLCFTDDCDVDWYFDGAAPSSNGLAGGQLTFDELYLNWFRTKRGTLALGRLQTRSVLRGGVYAKSLSRNDSNNVNVTWTDGVQGTYRASNGWNSTLILQHNSDGGPGSIRRDNLDFNDNGARTTYYAKIANLERWGPVVQRELDISYLPKSLLKDGDPDGRREDYWGIVSRIMFATPGLRENVRFRSGAEVGYAPETPTGEAAKIDSSVSGFAWNIVASVLDFLPNHNIGINYARTGAGWLLSPQYGQNEELFELRYQWRGPKGGLLEARVRWREEIEQQTATMRKGSELDFYLRMTFEFTLKDQ